MLAKFVSAKPHTFKVFSCDTALLNVWLDLGTKTTWLELEKHFFFA